MSETKNILNTYPTYQATIGIEVHVQLNTNSKIFCSCLNKFGDTPNTNICPICCGHPGTLPVLNKKVVENAILAGLATHCTINQHAHFDRKHYFYPDLPKGYQITQDKHPICSQGFIEIEKEDGTFKKIRILRIHMEEDAGKNIHTTTGKSLIDLNRAGTPLLEIVSQPDIENAYEAKNYLMQLHNIVRYLGISDGNMEEGSFRADVNVSVKKKTDESLGTRVELKNINSFRFIGQAIDFEIERQIKSIESGQTIESQTLLWDSKENKTSVMRTKEKSTDYRYFPEPDIPPLVIEQAWIETIRKQVPELPAEKLHRFHTEYGLSSYEAQTLIDDKNLAHFFEETAKKSNNPKLSANWILRDLLAYLKNHKIDIYKSPVTPDLLAGLIAEIDNGTISSKIAQTVFEEIANTGKPADILIKEKNLTQIDSEEELTKIVMAIIRNNPENVAKYRSGNDRVFQFFIGQAMKETKGKANPAVITELFKKHLA
ncbi:MAG: Asp-tRNA(Asn)/Glu-tRNA(Gln) amidotransferase subunit GatB [bacterium]